MGVGVGVYADVGLPQVSSVRGGRVGSPAPSWPYVGEMGVGGGASGRVVDVGRGPLAEPAVGVAGEAGEAGDVADWGDDGDSDKSASSSQESATGAAFALDLAFEDEADLGGPGSRISLESDDATSRDLGAMARAVKTLRDVKYGGAEREDDDANRILE